MGVMKAECGVPRTGEVARVTPVFGIASIAAALVAEAMCGAAVGVTTILAFLRALSETPSQPFDGGLFFKAALWVSLTGIIVGMVGLVKDGRKTLAIAGLVFNGVLLLVMVSLGVLGLLMLIDLRA